MNILLGEIGRSLQELQMGLQGTPDIPRIFRIPRCYPLSPHMPAYPGALNMSDPMELLLAALQLNRVPGGWELKALTLCKHNNIWRQWKEARTWVVKGRRQRANWLKSS